MDALFLAQDASVVENLQTAGSALWDIIQTHGVSSLAGAGIWHLLLRRSNRLKAKPSRK